MLPENAIEVKNISKKFKVYYDKGTTLKEKVLFEKRRKYENRVVLKDISFQVKKGEAIGLIGHNGCGKSTTLKLLTRIMYPDSGTIEINGRVSSLIELGAGFHPDMTGRENIYINAAIFGLTRKEIDNRLQDIIDFSELHEFIDNPVRTYSSGMYMRLAFSVAINVDAEVLLIDEILGVGDANFQAKCFNKLKEIKAKGTTIVIVSHSLNQIEQICERSLWIHDGMIREEGLPKEVHQHYLSYMMGNNVELEKNIENRKDEEQLSKYEVYDCVIPLGFSCQVAYQMNRLGLRTAAYPFDWLFTFETDSIIDAVKNDFEGWLEKKELVEEASPTRFRRLVDKKYGAIHQHIFPKEQLWEESYEWVKKKVDNRIKRMLDKKGKKILFVRIVNNDSEKIEDLESALVNKYGKNIHLLILKHTKKMQIVKCVTNLKNTEMYEVYQEEEIDLTQSDECAAWKGWNHHYDLIFQNIRLRENCMDLKCDDSFIDFWPYEENVKKDSFRWTKKSSIIDLREYIGCKCEIRCYSPIENKLRLCDAEKNIVKEIGIVGSKEVTLSINYETRFLYVNTDTLWSPYEVYGYSDTRKLGVRMEQVKIIREYN